MKLFPFAHATHPQWGMAANLALAQLRAQMALHGYASQPTLGLLYITDHYAADAQEILAHLSAELPEITDWSGTVGVGVVSNNVEYYDEPALALMLCEWPVDQYRVFSGVAPLGMAFEAQSALVHADGQTPELSELIYEMAARTDLNYLFGGVASSRGPSVHFAVSGNGNIKGQGAASGVFRGGLSGVAFGPGIPLVSRLSQGCLPLAGTHRITAAEESLILELDDEPALPVLLRELGVDLEHRQEAIEAIRATQVGLTETILDASTNAPTISATGLLGDDVMVRHIVGLDVVRGGVAVSALVAPGMDLVFCQRNPKVARTDLIRMCAEIREELEPQELALASAMELAGSEVDAAPHPARGIAGAVYVSCTGRGGHHFGSPNAELQIIRRALGDVPLVGFFAMGEIASRHLHAYSGVLTVFTEPAPR